MTRPSKKIERCFPHCVKLAEQWRDGVFATGELKQKKKEMLEAFQSAPAPVLKRPAAHDGEVNKKRRLRKFSKRAPSQLPCSPESDSPPQSPCSPASDPPPQPQPPCSSAPALPPLPPFGFASHEADIFLVTDAHATFGRLYSFRRGANIASCQQR